MPKFHFPPQGGEKRLCLTLFCSMMMTVIFAVLVIYAVVIIYLPAKTELESNLQGPKMCTVLSLERKLSGIEVCDSWSSCEEWCLSIVSQSFMPIVLPHQGHTCMPFCHFAMRWLWSNSIESNSPVCQQREVELAYRRCSIVSPLPAQR